jgi:hypothetical protein
MPDSNHVHLTKRSHFDHREAYSLIVPWYPARHRSHLNKAFFSSILCED